MPKALAPALLLVALLPWAAAASPVPATGVSGAFLEAEGRRPLAGALVALYEKGSGYLVDSTYTREDGRFTFRPPPKKGSYLLVATKGDVSKRAELAYDPAAPGVYREILHSSEKSFWGKLWASPLVSGIKGVFGTIGAFLLGYFLKQWEGRRGAAKTLNREVTQLRTLVARMSQKHREATQDLPKLLPDDRYRQILSDLLPWIADIEAELDKDSIRDAVFELRGVAGSNDYIAYRSRVQEIKDIASSQDAVGFAEAANRLNRLEALAGELETHSLMRARLPWWRRIWLIWFRGTGFTS